MAGSVGRTGSAGGAEDYGRGTGAIGGSGRAAATRLPAEPRPRGGGHPGRAKPAAYWRLDEFSGPRAVDASGRDCDALYEPAVAYFLEGPCSDGFCTEGETNRAAHFAGGRLQSRIPGLKDKYSISLWIWNGMPVDAREVSGWIFSRGHDHRLGSHDDHLGIGGTAGNQGRLIFLHGRDTEARQSRRRDAPRSSAGPGTTWSSFATVNPCEFISMGTPSLRSRRSHPPAFPPVLSRSSSAGAATTCRIGKAAWTRSRRSTAPFRQRKSRSWPSQGRDDGRLNDVNLAAYC